MPDEKLLRLQRVCNLAEVDKFQLRDLRQFLVKADGGDNFLNALERKIYEASDDLNDADFVSIAHPEEPDWFTSLTRGRISYLYHILTFGNKSGKTVRAAKLESQGHYNFKFVKHPDKYIQRTSMALYVALTSFLIGLAILTLNEARSFGARVSLVLVHNIVFTLAMAFLTHVKPVELFAAAAAYFAVLIVFASGSFGLAGSVAHA